VSLDTTLNERWLARVMDDYAAHNDSSEVGWRVPYVTARRQIEQAYDNGDTWCFVKIPFPFMDDQRTEYTKTLSFASSLGFERRPAGPSGLAFDAVLLERTGDPGVMG